MGKILENIWINKSVFNNNLMGSSFSNYRLNLFDDAYTIWEEANNTIKNSGDNKELLNQGFLSLKRAFNVASQILRKHMGIDQINYSGKSKRDFLGDIEFFGITKTLTLNRYLNIRNLIEHKNQNPPPKEDCLILSEYIWNYIRNVTYIMDKFRDSISYVNESSIYSKISEEYNCINFNYIVEEKNEKYVPHLMVEACIDLKYLSFVKKENHMVVNKIKLLNKYDRENLEDDVFRYDVDNLQSICFKGEITNHDTLAKYLKYMVLPEYGEIDEESIKKIF